MSLTTNDVSHSMIETHLLDSDLTLSPGFELLTRTTKPLILATPVPDLLVSSMVTMYSSPTLIGFFGDFDSPKRSLFFSYLS